MTNDLQFRRATADDTEKILYFIRALAAHVKKLDKVSVTGDMIREWLFEKQRAEVIFAMKDGKEVGFALYFYIFSTFSGKPGLFLEDLFVLPQHRGGGYGKGLLRELAGIAARRGCDKVEWHCLDWNQPSIDFYLSLGARVGDDFSVYTLSGDSLRHMAGEPGDAAANG